MTLAPIVLFVYNRSWHTQQTIAALQKNKFANESELFIYSDAAKNELAIQAVTEVRDFIKTVHGFKQVTIIEREKNWGLANSIIDGVTTIVNQYGRIIVLEDDLVTSPYFLQFMNEALDFYQYEETVFHISGYIFPINNENINSTFFIKPTSCWGWATWDRAWKFFKKDTSLYLSCFNKKMINDFNLDGAYSYFDQIKQNDKGLINTWAIFWYASSYLKNGLSLHPKKSFTFNIGHDGMGVHCKESSIFDVELADSIDYVFTREINEDLIARKQLKDFFGSIKIPIYQRVFNKLKRLIVQKLY